MGRALDHAAAGVEEKDAGPGTVAQRGETMWMATGRGGGPGAGGTPPGGVLIVVGGGRAGAPPPAATPPRAIAPPAVGRAVRSRGPFRGPAQRTGPGRSIRGA